MEAATPLFAPTSVRVYGDRLVVDGLVVDDPTAVRLAGEHDDPARLMRDAIEIGARVLDREQTASELDYVRGELEKVETAFTEKARTVAEYFGAKVDEALGPENGHLSKALQRHFADDSAVAVQHRVKAVMEDVMARSREELRRQFAADDASNPLVGFQRQSLAVMKTTGEQQALQLRAMAEHIAQLQAELARQRAEREGEAQLEAERERGTAKGRTFEELVHDALDRVALAQGDDCDAVGDQTEATRKVGDVVVAIDGCRGAPRGRIVFEAKNSRLSKARALEELDAALRERRADFAVLVVPSEEKVPARMVPLREYHGDKLIVTFDPEDGSTLSLQVAYSLARARVLMARSEAEGVDAAAIGEAVERALQALHDVQAIKQQLTGATTNIEKARKTLEGMADRVKAHLADVDELLAAEAEPEAAD